MNFVNEYFLSYFEYLNQKNKISDLEKNLLNQKLKYNNNCLNDIIYALLELTICSENYPENEIIDTVKILEEIEEMEEKKVNIFYNFRK